MIGAPCMSLLLDLANLCRQRLSRTQTHKSPEGVGDNSLVNPIDKAMANSMPV